MRLLTNDTLCPPAVLLFVCGADLMFLHERGLYVCASQSFTFLHHLLSFFFLLSFFSHPALLVLVCVCVCVSTYKCVTAVVCLFTFSLLSTFTRLGDLLWTWPWMPHRASSSFLIFPSFPLFFFLPFVHFLQTQERQWTQEDKNTKSQLTAGERNRNCWKGKKKKNIKCSGAAKMEERSKSNEKKKIFFRCWAELQLPSAFVE